MGKSGPLRDAIKGSFYPFVMERGFVLEKATALFVPFHRTAGGKQHYFDMQWDKYHEPRFVLNFEERSSGVGDQADDQTGAEAKPDPRHPGVRVQRLQRRRGGSLGAWFQTRKPFGQVMRTMRWRYTPEEVAHQLITAFAELELWWETKEEGPHIYIYQSPSPSGA